MKRKARRGGVGLPNGSFFHERCEEFGTYPSAFTGTAKAKSQRPRGFVLTF